MWPRIYHTHINVHSVWKYFWITCCFSLEFHLIFLGNCSIYHQADFVIFSHPESCKHYKPQFKLYQLTTLTDSCRYVMSETHTTVVWHHVDWYTGITVFQKNLLPPSLGSPPRNILKMVTVSYSETLNYLTRLVSCTDDGVLMICLFHFSW